ncbi:MAG TPA: hypothetical protein VG389_18615 [Myxococcota bacterium]|jgi:hypothetical protein|nr:hypothetical protein [Myxococcota bacterium]
MNARYFIRTAAFALALAVPGAALAATTESGGPAATTTTTTTTKTTTKMAPSKAAKSALAHPAKAASGAGDTTKAKGVAPRARETAAGPVPATSAPTEAGGAAREKMSGAPDAAGAPVHSPAAPTAKGGPAHAKGAKTAKRAGHSIQHTRR